MEQPHPSPTVIVSPALSSVRCPSPMLMWRDDLMGSLLRKRWVITNAEDSRSRGLWLLSTRVEMWNDSLSDRCKHRGLSGISQGVNAIDGVKTFLCQFSIHTLELSNHPGNPKIYDHQRCRRITAMDSYVFGWQIGNVCIRHCSTMKKNVQKHRKFKKKNLQSD